MYQGTVEGKLTLRLVQWSFFAEGGLGAARMSSNLLYARGLAKYRTGFTAGGGGGIDYHFLSRHFSIGLRGDYYVLRDVTSSQDLIDDHVPEVHVLMRARGCSRSRCPPSSRSAARPSISASRPPDINACRPSQQFFVDRDLAQLPGQGRLPGRHALLRRRLPRRAGAERAAT